VVFGTDDVGLFKSIEESVTLSGHVSLTAFSGFFRAEFAD
jgi:hypothetical protein